MSIFTANTNTHINVTAPTLLASYPTHDNSLSFQFTVERLSGYAAGTIQLEALTYAGAGGLGLTVVETVAYKIVNDSTVLSTVTFDNAQFLLPASSTGTSVQGFRLKHVVTAGGAVVYLGYVKFDILAQNVEFVLPTLDDLTLSLATSPAYLNYTMPTITGNGYADINVNVADFQNLFLFRTDDIDVMDTQGSDIEYATNDTKWNAGAVVKFSESELTTGTAVAHATSLFDATQMQLAYDYVRHLAKEVTGGYASSDIFSNEVALRDVVVAADTTLDTSIRTKLRTMGEAIAGATTMTSSTFDRDSDTNISYSILSQLLSQNLHTQNRVHSILHSRTAGSTQWMAIPMIAGDSLVVKVNYSQSNSSPLGDAVIADRSYRVTLHLI
jgi:hypothetical protein